jgi:HPt (histidine-containing phosphotransfer) domain-containing protein
VLDLPRDDVLHVLSVFDEECKRLSALIRTVAENGDPVAFRRTAHALAGAAGAVGADSLERASRAAMAREAPLRDAMLDVANEIATLTESARSEAADVVAHLAKVAD